MGSARPHPQIDRRIRTKKEIKQLISERNSVLSQFYNLSHHKDAHETDNVETILELLQDFCQDMIDYIATGHFEIYRRIEEGDERRIEILKLSDEVFHKISRTTKVAINFNDVYDTSNEFNSDILHNLPTQLTELGENFAIRIEHEDKLINTLLDYKPRLARSTN